MCSHMWNKTRLYDAHDARGAGCTDLEEFVKEEGEPVREHLLCNRLRSEMPKRKRGTKVNSVLGSETLR